MRSSAADESKGKPVTDHEAEIKERAPNAKPDALPSEDAQPELPDSKQLLKLAVELGPLVAFFFVNSRAGIFYGTGAFMLATVVALLLSRMLFGRVPIMPLVTGVFVLIFGGLTLFLQDELFIKMKPTIVNGLFALILTGGMIYRHTLLKYVFGEVFRLTEEGWRQLSWRWIGFFIFLAIINEVVWRNFSTDFWVSFKVFGIMPLTMVFGVSQIGLLKRYELKTI